MDHRLRAILTFLVGVFPPLLGISLLAFLAVDAFPGHDNAQEAQPISLKYRALAPDDP